TAAAALGLRPSGAFSPCNQAVRILRDRLRSRRLGEPRTVWQRLEEVWMNRKFLRGFGLAALAAAIVVGVASGVERKAAVAPANSSAPSISGTASTGSTVTANQGTWTGSAPISYQYQWQVCDDKGNACHDITGATAQTYVIKDADKGNTLRVEVIASNSD